MRSNPISSNMEVERAGKTKPNKKEVMIVGRKELFVDVSTKSELVMVVQKLGSAEALSQVIPHRVKQLLQEFEGLIDEPNELPPM